MLIWSKPYIETEMMPPIHMSYDGLKWNGLQLFFFNLLSFFISQQNVDSAHYTDVIMSTIASRITSRSPPDCLLNRLYWSKKTPKLRVTGLYVPGPMISPHKWPVTRILFYLVTPSCLAIAAKYHMATFLKNHILSKFTELLGIFLVMVWCTIW